MLAEVGAELSPVVVGAISVMIAMGALPGAQLSLTATWPAATAPPQAAMIGTVT
jgi:hypothetical protein